MEIFELIKDAVTKLLEPEYDLYKLEVIPGKKEYKIRVFLDKLDSPYGTPAIDDCVRYSKMFQTRFSAMAEEGLIPEDYTIEVSSPGAEREVYGQEAWDRFSKLPMKVLYKDKSGTTTALVANYAGTDGDTTNWIIADVEFNVRQGRYKKNMKKEDRSVSIPSESIQSVKLFLDFSGR